MDYDVVVLAGGTGRRLGGVDKGALVVAGVPLLDRVLAATAGARRTVVVGARRATARPVTWTREDPPGGGPLAALAAGLAALPGTCPGSSHDEQIEDGEEPGGPVVVLATDLPWLRPEDVARLLTTLTGGPADAAVFTDEGDRLQPLAAAYRRRPLRAALAMIGPVDGRPVRLVLERLAVARVQDLGAAGDCDTPAQLARARAHFDRRE